MSAILLAAIAEEGIKERGRGSWTSRLCNLFLGQCPEIDILFERSNLFNENFPCLRRGDGFQGLLNIFTTLFEYKLFIFLLCNYLLILKIPTEILLRILFFVTGTLFSSVDPSLAAGKMCQFYLSQAAFGKILQGHKRLPGCSFRFKLPLWGLWRGSLKAFSELVHSFKRA